MKSPAAGILLLLISFLIGLTKIYYGRFVDEADTVTVGWLITKGYILYRDVFSHHFPFPYYWAAGVVSLFGNSFAAIRVSILLLQITLFGIGMGLTRNYLAIGMASLVWNLINQFLRGQQAIYPTFEGLFMLVVFLLLFSSLVKRSELKRPTLALTGSLLGLALLTDPLMVYPACVAVAGLFLSGLVYSSWPNFREGFHRVLVAGIPAVLILGIFAVHLLSSGTIRDFYQSTIWFNAEVYTKYVDADPIRVGRVVEDTLSGLNILNPQWVKQLSPFIPLNSYRSVSLEDEALYFSWIFSNFLFRMSILVCALGLILNRKAIAGIFLYLFSAAMLVRADEGLYTIGFTLVSLFAAFYLLGELWRPAMLVAPTDRQASWLRSALPKARFAWVPLLVLVGAMQFWSGLRGGLFLADHPREVLSDRHITQYQQFGDELRTLTCNQEGLELDVFPNNPIVYFVTGLPPASRYTFMYPWVAEVGQRELIQELKQNSSAVVWINIERKSGSPEGVTTYMADTIDFLNKDYVVVEGGLWVSPQLAENCSVRQKGNFPINSMK